jgi:hypothetical protein
MSNCPLLAGPVNQASAADTVIITVTEDFMLKRATTSSTKSPTVME